MKNMNYCLSVLLAAFVVLSTISETVGSIFDHLLNEAEYEYPLAFDEEDSMVQFVKPKSDEYLLREKIMANYSSDTRPVLNSSTVTYVNISLNNIQIINLVSEKTLHK